MTGQPTRSEMLPPMTVIGGRDGWLVGGRFYPRIAGAEDDPKPGEGDPPGGDGGTGKDGKEFDAARAQATIDKLRGEVNAGKATAKELEAAKAKLKEIEDRDKTEAEKLAGAAKEASEKLTAAEQRAQDLAIRLAVERTARKLNFIDEDDAFRLIDRKSVELDDDGAPTNVEKLLADLAKAKPHLVKADGEQKPPATKGPAPTPKPSGKAPTRDELIAEKTKQLRESGSYARLG